MTNKLNLLNRLNHLSKYKKLNGPIGCAVGRVNFCTKKNENDGSVEVTNTNSYLPDTIPEKDRELVTKLKLGDRIYPYKSQTDKVVTILSNDVKRFGRKCLYYTTGINLGNLKVEYFLREADFVIVGSGIVGMCIAYAMKRDFPNALEITIVDRNENCLQRNVNLGSGTLSHNHFVDEEEVFMSEYCTQFLADFHNHSLMIGHDQMRIPYDPMGGLYLANQNTGKQLLSKRVTLERHNLPSNVMDPNAIKKKFPWLNVDDILFGTLNTVGEGTVDPWVLMTALKCKLINAGVRFVTADIVDIAKNKHKFERVILRLPDGKYERIDFGELILAGGMESQKLINLMNIRDDIPFKVKLPLQQKYRYEYCFHNPNGPGLDTPMIYDPDGTYFRREGLGGHYVAGVTNITDPGTDDPESREDGLKISLDNVYRVLEEKIRPFLKNRLNGFDNLDLKQAWVTPYCTNAANDVGVIGNHPYCPEIVFAIGFTKCGILYGPAVGNAVMELLCYEEYRTMDLSMYEVDNLYRKQHLEADRLRRQKLLEQEKKRAVEQG